MRWAVGVANHEQATDCLSHQANAVRQAGVSVFDGLKRGPRHVGVGVLVGMHADRRPTKRAVDVGAAGGEPGAPQGVGGGIGQAQNAEGAWIQGRRAWDWGAARPAPGTCHTTAPRASPASPPIDTPRTQTGLWRHTPSAHGRCRRCRGARRQRRGRRRQWPSAPVGPACPPDCWSRRKS